MVNIFNFWFYARKVSSGMSKIIRGLAALEFNQNGEAKGVKN